MRPAFATLLAGLAFAAGPLAAAAQEQAQPPAQAKPEVKPETQPQPPVPPQAVPTPPAAESARFSFHRVGDAFVRLDSATGQVAQCAAQGTTGWTCAAAPEDRSALENEIARLQRENASLKKTLLARGEGPNPPGANSPGAMTETKPEARPVPPGNVPDPSAKPPGQFQPPSEADVDRALAYVKNVWRKLVDMMMDLQRDIQQRKG